MCYGGLCGFGVFADVMVLLLTSTFSSPPPRGGVLEAEGTVEIKFRRKDLVKTMRRVDPVYTGLAERLGQFTTGVCSPQVLNWVQQNSPEPGWNRETLIKIHNDSSIFFFSAFHQGPRTKNPF